MKTGLLSLALLMAAAACSGCNGGGSSNGVVAAAPAGVSMQRLAVTSRSFSSNGTIPVDYTCDGTDKSPQLTWSAAPSGTKSFAILVVDPDAVGGEFVHWVAFDLRADATSVPESSDTTELGGVPGTNGFGRTGYSGPCPPKFELHSYAFRVYALDATLAVRSGVTADDLNEAMNGHVLAQGTLVGTFSH
jgi:Raf kinase inhibitor-like YbhB/YbcL family protein